MTLEIERAVTIAENIERLVRLRMRLNDHSDSEATLLARVVSATQLYIAAANEVTVAQSPDLADSVAHSSMGSRHEFMARSIGGDICKYCGNPESYWLHV